MGNLDKGAWGNFFQKAPNISSFRVNGKERNLTKRISFLSCMILLTDLKYFSVTEFIHLGNCRSIPMYCKIPITLSK